MEPAARPALVGRQGHAARSADAGDHVRRGRRAVSFFLRRTRLGTYVYAIGDNPFGARVTGIPTRPVIVLQYVLAALIGISPAW